METFVTSSSATLPPSSPFSIFPLTSPTILLSPKTLHFRLPSKRDDDRDSNFQSNFLENNNNNDDNNKNFLPIISDRRHLSLSPLSKDDAMGLVLSAAAGRGWTTGSGMEGPPVPADKESGIGNISTFPWSLFTKSPRRRMLVAFTCTICRQRTTRAINPHAYTDGTVFVQCCGCNAYHKLVDHLNLFQETNCYLNSSFKYTGDGWDDLKFRFMDIDDEDDDTFPIS